MKFNKLKISHFLLVLASSFLLTLSMPGYNLSVLAFVALTPLIYVIIKKEINPYFAGLIFSLVFYIINLRWLIITISHFGNAPIYVSILILILFALYLSIYWVAFVYFVTRFKGIFIISTLYIILEIIKGRLFTGFPWLNLGQSQFNNTYILSLASFVGEYGLSFIIIAINIILAKYFLTRKFKFLIYCFTLILIIYIAGFEIYNKRIVKEIDTTIAIAQPAYEQQIKWSQEYTDEIINQVKYLIDKAMKGRSSIIVLPEALFPVLINNDLELLNYMTILSYKKSLIFGNIRADNINGKYKFYNSAFYISNGNIEFYDKIHLVPFGEYFPLQNIFKPVKYYFFGDSDAFSRGYSIKNFIYKDLSISPLICYEGAFVDLVQKAAKKNNDVFVILTNDSWFGKSIGRYQHLAISVIRAVETGKFVIRAAQSGISACIGPDGKIDNSLDIDKSDIIECNLRIQKRATVFNTVQYLWIFLCIIIIIFNYSVKRFYKLHKQPHKP